MRQLFLIICTLFLIGIIGCSNENDELLDEKGSEQGIPNGSELSVEDSLEIEFYLLNSKLEKTSTFKYGENIVFSLTISNRANRPIEIWLPKMFLDVFRVYTKNGTDMGQPFSGSQLGVLQTFKPASSSTYRCPWFTTTDFNASIPFMKVKNEYWFPEDTLSSGEYYVESKIRLEGSQNPDRVLRKEFIIE